MEDINMMIVSYRRMSSEILMYFIKKAVGISNLTKANGCKDIITKIDRFSPNLILFDLGMSATNSLSDIKKIKHKYPKTKLLVIDSIFNKSRTKRLINVGIDGYVHLNESANNLRLAIASVLRGQYYISPEIATILAIDVIENESELFDQLTDKEYEVLSMFIHGIGQKDIAKKLNIRAKTIGIYLSNASKKVTAKNRSELILKALKHKLVLNESIANVGI